MIANAVLTAPIAVVCWFGRPARPVPAGRTFRRAIHENELTRLLVLTDHIRFAAGAFHFRERPQFFRIGLQPGLHLGPHQTCGAAHVLFKPGFQRDE